MIDHISIDGFKCLRDVTMTPKAINVLVGPNGSGKSSVLQSLLLLRQSVDPDLNLDSLHLSGELYEAGMPVDALHPSAGHLIEIEINTDDGFNLHGSFKYDREDVASANSRILKADLGGTLNTDAMKGFALFSRGDRFGYLNAERIGPRLTQGLPPGDLDGKVGKFGQFTAAILARAYHSEERVAGWDEATEAKFSNALVELDGGSLVDQLQNAQGGLFRLSNIMLGWIIPGSEFEATENVDTDNAALMFTRDASGTKTKTRSTHVGFGLSYSLPIIVAALSLSPGGLLLLENPEAHLHPYGQSRIGAFLALMASTGRQIFLETHSDHVVNGIRLAVKYGLISPEDVRFFFFHDTHISGQSKVATISVDSHATLTSWPAEFFDQIERDLARL